MLSKKYRLSYLPLFFEDLDEKVTYIAGVLRNPKAANDLLDKVETGQADLILQSMICHGRTLKNSEKTCKINGFTARKGVYYTTTTPFRERGFDMTKFTVNMLVCASSFSWEGCPLCVNYQNIFCF